jgi:hypothetical protein
MITNIGKGILAKYLLGQAPAYASHIAVGCGPQALRSEDESFTEQQKEEYSNKRALDFEMFRVPIVSKGYVNENNLVKLVLTAELPTEERYEITEVGIFSAGSNPSAAAFDSKFLYSFSQTEGWENHTTSGMLPIPPIYSPLNSETDEIISPQYLVAGVSTEAKVFHTNADNRTFTSSARVSRNERCRIQNNIVVISGDHSALATDPEQGVTYVSGSHIHIAETSINLNRNSPSDELRLAFSLINKDGASSQKPDNVKILVQFSSSDTENSGQFASFAVNIDDVDFDGTAPDSKNFSNNRYFVVSKKLEDLYYTSGFNWNIATIVKVYASVTDDGQPSDDYYVCLDAMRLENVSTNNPLYGLTGYSAVRTDGALPIVKSANTSNFIEFRVSIGVE